MNRLLGITLILSLSLALGACHGKGTPMKPSAGGESVPSQSGTTSGAKEMGAGEAQPLGGTGGADAGVLKTTIYFDFDSSEIRPEFASTLAAHGKKIGADKSLKVRLEGNTDERGSAEYNVALGERRAQAVKRALLLEGAAGPQLSTVSYGEERPVAEGHDETAWAQNRRVDIIYVGGR